MAIGNSRWVEIALAGVTVAGIVGVLVRSTVSQIKSPPVVQDICDLIGGTALIRIGNLSKRSGCNIYGKLEMSNPGGSAKDRVALAIILDAEKTGKLIKGQPDHVYEGTSGSTGISLAIICQARGYEAHIVLPDDTSAEKVSLLRALGAHLHLVRPAGIADAGHYVNVARRLAEETNMKGLHRAIFANQFETEHNWRAHYATTGPELWSQLGHKIDAFVSGAGTGGTITGVARYLKSKKPSVEIVLADPPGSGLFNKVNSGVMFDNAEREGTRRRHQVDTIVEGIGLNRITSNLGMGLPYIDSAERVTDKEALAMAHDLVESEGLFVGSSSAVNCVVALREAIKLGPGHTVVTILCDSGSRHLSKFWAQSL